MERELHSRGKERRPAPVGFAQTRERIGAFAEEGCAAQGERPIAVGWLVRGRTFLLRLPPPLVYVAAFLLGVGLQRVVPLPRLLPGTGVAVEVAGAILLALGILLGPLNALMFLARGTTLDPMRSPSRLFTGGVYRVTRNPMYIGLLLVYAGVALLRAEPWSLALVVVPFAVVDRLYIPCEEERLAARFGQAYAAYCGRVRRWWGVTRQQR